MLIVIDAQNCNLDPVGEKYIAPDNGFVKRLMVKIQDSMSKGEPVLYTRDIPIEQKGKNEDSWALQVVDDLKPVLQDAQEIEKYYYGIAPKKMQEIEIMFSNRDFTSEKIEIIGVETDICVLANLILFLSTFPEADFIVSKRTVQSSNKEKEQHAFEIFDSLGIKVVE